MQYEKIITRSDGGRIKIIVWLSISDFESNFKYTHFFSHCEPNKRKFQGYLNEKYVPTKEEIHYAKIELWQKIRAML